MNEHIVRLTRQGEDYDFPRNSALDKIHGVVHLRDESNRRQETGVFVLLGTFNPIGKTAIDVRDVVMVNLEVTNVLANIGKTLADFDENNIVIMDIAVPSGTIARY